MHLHIGSEGWERLYGILQSTGKEYLKSVFKDIIRNQNAYSKKKFKYILLIQIIIKNEPTYFLCPHILKRK